jgi:hypothetical protein
LQGATAVRRPSNVNNSILLDGSVFQRNFVHVPIQFLLPGM